jgi:hypothetical protein
MTQALIQRAYSAYLQSDGISTEQPTSRSGVEVIGDLKYVVLRNERRVLAVYRVRRSGLLRRMRRWPLALNNISQNPVGRESARAADASLFGGNP